MRAQIYSGHAYMHYFQSAVTHNTINSMHVCMHIAVPAAHCYMVYMLCIIL